MNSTTQGGHGPEAPPEHRRAVAASVDVSLFVEELRDLAGLATRCPGLRLVVGEPGSGWSFNWRDRVISIDGRALVEQSPDFNRGLLLHECAHAAITRLGDIVPVSYLRQAGIHLLLNAVEDCRIETWMQQRFPGCRPWVREYNDILVAPAKEREPQRFLAMQFLFGIVQRWWLGSVPAAIDPEVQRALAEVWPAVERCLAAQPPLATAGLEWDLAYAKHPVARCYAAHDYTSPPDAYEKGIRLAQYSMWSVVFHEILPVFQRLIDMDPDHEGLTRQIRMLLARHPARHMGGAQAGDQAVETQPNNGPGQAAPADRAEMARALQPDSKDPYMAAWHAQLKAIEQLGDDLLRWFQTHDRLRYRERCPTGTRIQMRMAMRFDADPSVYDKLWRRPMLPRRLDPHFTLLIDRSGSMDGDKIRETFMAVVLLCEVCRRTGVALSVYAFSDQTERLLRWDESLEDNIRARLASLPSSASGGTEMAGALRQVHTELPDAPFRDQYLFVLSDGEPGDELETRQAINGLSAAGVGMVGLGLGPDTARLAEFFPACQTGLNASDLPAVLSRLLSRILKGGR